MTNTMSFSSQWQSQSASTRYLTFIFIGVLMVVIILLSGQRLFGYQNQLKKELKQVRQQLKQQENIYQIQSQIESEQQWLIDNPIPQNSQQTIESQLQERATKSAAKHKVEVLKQTLLTAQLDEQGLNQANLELIVRSSEKEFYQWAHELHNPKLFCIVTQLKLENDKSNPKLIQAKVHLQQWFEN